MLTSGELEKIRERCGPVYSAHAREDVEALLDTVEELRELLDKVMTLYTWGDTEALRKQVEEVLK